MSTLSMNHVTYTYKNAGNPAVSDASFTFEPGKLYAVVGPSGSGKSTLLSMMAGLDLPTEGEIHYDGNNLREMDLDRYRREDISMIFQAFQLFPLLTVMENVCYPMELSGVAPSDAKERAAQYLAKVGITEEQMKRFPANLSGGEQQRVAIARSLASGARTFLADEPTGNLDVANTENIMDLLCGLAHADGYCVIVVTHDQEVAQMADVRLEMRGGVLRDG